MAKDFSSYMHFCLTAFLTQYFTEERKTKGQKPSLQNLSFRTLSCKGSALVAYPALCKSAFFPQDVMLSDLFSCSMRSLASVRC